MNNKEITIKALNNFKQAYFDLLTVWNNDDSILNSDISLEKYPFNKSFDELDIMEWVDSITEATE